MGVAMADESAYLYLLRSSASALTVPSYKAIRCLPVGLLFNRFVTHEGNNIVNKWQKWRVWVQILICCLDSATL